MVNIETPEGIYAHIAQSLIGSVADAWLEIRLHVDVIDGSVGLTGECDLSSGRTTDLDVRKLNYTVSKAIRNLHRQMSSAGQEPWCRAVFVLKPDGLFEFRLSPPSV